MLDSLHPTCRPLPRPSTSWAWYKVGPHPLLSNLAAGASFYIVVRGNKDRRDIGDGEEWELLVAVYKDRTYLMPRDMAQLLHDAGMEFRKSDAQSWARFGAVIYAWTVRSIVERWSARERELPEFGLRRPVFPALTIESNVPDTLSGDAFVGWPEYLVVGGQRETLFVLAVRQRLHSPVEGDSFVGILPVMFKPNRVGTDIDVYYPRSDATDEDVRFGFKLPNPCLYTDSLGGTRLPGTQAKVIDARESCQHA